MQVTTLTRESVTLVMPFQFAFERIEPGAYGSAHFRVYLKGIGRDRWFRVNKFVAGESPVLDWPVMSADKIQMLNSQVMEGKQ